MTTARWWQNGWIWLALVTAVAGGMLVAWLLYPAPIVQRDAVVPQLRGVATDQAVAELAALGLRGRIAPRPGRFRGRSRSRGPGCPKAPWCGWECRAGRRA